jgi:hypothetical protein
MFTHAAFLALLAAPDVNAAEPQPLVLEPLVPVASAFEPTPMVQDTQRAGFSYTYIEANYVWLDSDDLDDSIDGFELEASFEIMLNIFLQASYSKLEGDADVDYYKVGAGWHFPICDTLDLYGVASWAGREFDIEDFEGDNDDNGPALAAGARFWLTPKLEINGEAEWTDIEDSEAAINAGARWYFVHNFSLGANVRFGEDDETVAAGLRFSF